MQNALAIFPEADALKAIDGGSSMCYHKNTTILNSTLALNKHAIAKGPATRSDLFGCRTPDFALCHALAEYLREEKHDDR